MSKFPLLNTLWPEREQTKPGTGKLATSPIPEVLHPQQPASLKPFLGQAPASQGETRPPMLTKTMPKKAPLSRTELVAMLGKLNSATPPHLPLHWGLNLHSTPT